MTFRIVDEPSVSVMEADMRTGLKQLDIEERDCAAGFACIDIRGIKKFQTLFQTFQISVEAALESRAL